ncbi:MAG: iron-containing alcohol dehydrogenase, partial [Gammaproteobacteria bacterium]
FTQLIESYVSTRANSFTDALALDGIKAVIEGFILAWHGGDTDKARFGRNKMAYASLLSGITLAQVGLGSVHGLASPLGAFFPIPHGVVCGTLLAEATQLNISAMQERDDENIALVKYATIGRLISKDFRINDIMSFSNLVSILNDWTELFELPRLSQYGVTKDDFKRIVADSRGSSMKTNPIVLTDSEIKMILTKRL